MTAGPEAAFLAGGGEMGQRIRDFDWSATPLGEPEDWPQSLKTSVGIMLNSGYPMYISWGAEFTQLYNDAYRPILGETKHPAALGETTDRTFEEIWPDIGPMFQAVLDEAKPSTFTDLMLPLNRYGFPEECFFVFSYSPVLTESGRAGGVFVTVLETTDRVLRERRQKTLKDIAAIHAQGERDRINRRAVDVIGSCPQDSPFVAICLCDDEGHWSVGARQGALDLPDAEILRVLREAGGESATATPVDLGTPAHAEPWPEPITQVTFRPILPPGVSAPAGMLVFGLSPRLRLDAAYTDFHTMCAANLAAVIADAEAFAIERERARSLAEIDRAKTVFFSNVSHEFRTPITLMLGPIEDALGDQTRFPDGSPERDQLVTVHRNAMRLSRLVNSLLDFSRLEAGRANARFEPTRIDRFTCDLVSNFQSAAEKAGLSLIVESERIDQAVHVDRDMWENIVLNLVSNAVKYTLEGTIRVRIGVSEDGKRAECEFSDTGIGIAREEMPRLFERFHRIEGAPGRSIEGSGIGLALVKELTELHGADLSVSSEPGEGTTFKISIPFGTRHLPRDQVVEEAGPIVPGKRSDGFVAEVLRWLPSVADNSAAEARTESANAEPDAAARGRVLVVDDNADMRDYLHYLLESHGYEVTIAKDGLDALEAISRDAPELVISDLMMPRLDGMGLLAELRANRETRDIPFLAVSARAGEEAVIEGLNAGADDYLVKPFSRRELFARADSAIRMSRVRQRGKEAVEDEYRRLQRLFEQAPSFIATLRGPNHVVEFANAAYRKIVGLDRDLIGLPIAEAIPEVVSQGFVELLDRVYRTGTRYIGEDIDAWLDDGEGKPRREVTVNFIYEPITDNEGVVVGVLIEGQDVTIQKRAKEHLELLVSELNHRVKNMLAIVQGVSQQTFRSEGSERERRAFEGRLSALAAAHDLLTRRDWGAPTLHEVALELFSKTGNRDRIEIDGPELKLNSRTAVTVAMALHELHTNAIKYGSLSNEEGRVVLRWRLQEGEDESFVLEWRESGGPQVGSPRNRGFGSRLIEQALAAELDGTATLDFQPHGLICTIRAKLPLAELASG